MQSFLIGVKKSSLLFLKIVKKILIIISVIIGFLIVLFGISGIIIWHKAGSTIKNIPALTNPEAVVLPAPINIYSADNKKIGTTIVQNRIIVSPRQITAPIRNAIISIEDQRFYDHHGVDFNGVLRAAYINFKTKKDSQGASTITMQYVNNVYLNRTKTFNRKINQTMLALQLEGVWTKERILTSYLNTVYFGNGAYGIEAASRYYFGIHARELKISQAAMLAGIVQNPNQYDPYNFPQETKKRRNLVLNEMFAQGYISKEALLKARMSNIRIKKQHEFNKPKEPLLFSFALREANKKLPDYIVARGGYNIYTTFNLNLIRYARKVINEQYKNENDKPAITISQVNPRTGGIITIAQSPYKKKSFNLATQAQRQPGSTVKAFTLASLINSGKMSLSSPVNNSTVTAKTSSNKTINITPSYGATNLLEAITFSQNPAFYRLYQQAGPKQVLKLEKNLGLTNMDSNPAAGLGGTKRGTNTLELASAYGGFAANGIHYNAFSVNKILLSNGMVLYKHLPDKKRVLAPEAARTSNVALSNVVNHGFPLLQENLSKVRTRYPMAGKTGTSQDNADAWFVGYTPNYSAAVWTGYPSSRKPMATQVTGGVTGSSIPAKVWADYSSYSLKYLNISKNKFSYPLGLRRIPSIKNLSIEQAQIKLTNYNFNYTLSPINTTKYPPNKILGTNPKAGSWVKKNTIIKLRYVNNKRAIPNLVGMDYLKARLALGRFTNVEIKTKATNNNYKTGEVFSQVPAAGTLIDINSNIVLTIRVPRAPAKIIKKKITDPALVKENNDLKNTVIVPNVVGLKGIDAEAVLLSLGFYVRNRARSNIVESQSLTPSNRVKIGSEIILRRY